MYYHISGPASRILGLTVQVADIRDISQVVYFSGLQQHAPHYELGTEFFGLMLVLGCSFGNF